MGIEIISALSPLVVSLLTQGVKKLKTIRLSKYKKTYVRFGVALLSYVVAIGSALLGDGTVDPGATETFANAFVNFATALGIYHLGKK